MTAESLSETATEQASASEVRKLAERSRIGAGIQRAAEAKLLSAKAQELQGTISYFEI